MKVWDIWDDEFMDFRSPFMTRLDGLPVERLKKTSEEYKELDIKRNKLYEDYRFLCDLVENNDLEKQSFTQDDMDVVKSFLKIARDMDDYERLEIYRLGFHDCMALMEWVHGK